MGWNRLISAKECGEYIDILTVYLKAIDQQYVEDLPANILRDCFEKANELERLKQIDRCDGNMLQFGLEYFSDARNIDNNGKFEGFDLTDASQGPEFHKDNEYHEQVIDKANQCKDSNSWAQVACKVDLVIEGIPVARGRLSKHKHTVIFFRNACCFKGVMEWILNQLKYNEKLWADIGPLLSPKDQAFITDNSEAFIAGNQELSKVERLQNEKAEALKKAQEIEQAGKAAIGKGTQSVIKAEFRVLSKELRVQKDAMTIRSEEIKRFKNYGLGLADALLDLILGKATGLTMAEDKYNEVVNALVMVLVLAGVINNPSIGSGYKDDRKF